MFPRRQTRVPAIAHPFAASERLSPQQVYRGPRWKYHQGVLADISKGPVLAGLIEPQSVHLGLHAAAIGTHEHDHFVEFYADDRSLIDSVRTFISKGLTDGDSALVVASSAHRKAIEGELARTLDLPAARIKGLYSSFDAKETLALFMRQGRPDPAEFRRVAGKLLSRATKFGKNVRIFGEMVAILWSQGNHAAAIELEEHWNLLMKDRRFKLFCGYPGEVLQDADEDAIHSLFHTHSQVVLPAPV